MEVLPRGREERSLDRVCHKRDHGSIRDFSVFRSAPRLSLLRAGGRNGVRSLLLLCRLCRGFAAMAIFTFWNMAESSASLRV